MTTGLQTANTNPRSVIIRVAEGVIAAVAANAIPTYASAGIDLKAELDKVFPAKSAPLQCVVHIYNTAGSATVAATFKLWGGDNVSARYGVLGTGAGSAAGVINGGASMDEVGADVIDRYDVVTLPAVLDKIAAQCTAISGTDTAVNIDLLFQYAEGA